MPKYSTASLNKLGTCHCDLQTIFKYLIQIHDVTIICGHRGEKAQNKAYFSGNSTKKFPTGNHNKSPSMAVDAMKYYKQKPHLRWGDKKAVFIEIKDAIFEIAAGLLQQGIISHKVRWGGDWDMDGDYDDQRLNDLVHFELVKP